VLKTVSGHPINSDRLAKSFRSILKQAGLPRVRLYDLRHTAATLALAAGVSPKVVSEQLGHANAAFTLDTYAHVLPHMQDEAAAKVEAMLFGQGSSPARLSTLSSALDTDTRFGRVPSCFIDAHKSGLMTVPDRSH